MTSKRINVLFICSRNRRRSPTAERLWRDDPRVSARSTGTSPSARRVIGAADLRWADLICVMEYEHRQRILQSYRPIIADTPIHVLDIPDEYEYMDDELIDLLTRTVEPLLGR